MVVGGWYGMNCELSLIYVAILAAKSKGRAYARFGKSQ
jgi:hypothetical protein